jgi:hypothetical protein
LKSFQTVEVVPDQGLLFLCEDQDNIEEWIEEEEEEGREIGE